MRIPPWTPEQQLQPAELVDAILARRGGQLTELDRALLWSGPLARGWNAYLKAMTTELSLSHRLRGLSLCTVALLIGAQHEYQLRVPDFLADGGTPEQLAALTRVVAHDARQASDAALDEADQRVVRYTAQMTLDARADPALLLALKDQLGTTQLVELTAIAATYNMVGRFLLTLDIASDD